VADEPAPRELTLEEARAALPAARDARERLQALQGRLRTLRREQVAHAAHANEALAAVRATGAELRAIDPGLLDFSARVEGQPAYWCSRSGETELGWWHTCDTGFAGRRPISG
jgi:hypothetical protein